MNQAEVARLSVMEQRHSGSGDNVRDKIYIEIKSLVPSDLLAPMGMVFESIRRKDSATAKIQMAVLKSMAQQDPETAALVEVISIYGGLVETKDRSKAWGAVSKIAASATSDIVKDICLAALLQLSYRTGREDEARNYYLAELAPGIYAKEAFLRFYADQAQLEASSQKFIHSEGELTAVVEGALRLELTSLAISSASSLKETYPSYNSSVLCVLSQAFNLNIDIAQRHLWLSPPEVKQKLDALAEQVVELLELSEGNDARLYDIACPMYEYYQGLAPSSLFEALKKYFQYLEPIYPTTAARFKVIAGDYSGLSQLQRELKEVKSSSNKRATWCKNFLKESNHTLESVVSFILYGTPSEIGDWLSKKTPIDDASTMEVAFVRLLGFAYQTAGHDTNLAQRQQLAKQVDLFLSDWKEKITSIAPAQLFDLAEQLISAKLPDKAISFTSLLIPDQALWSSPFVLTHLESLLKAEQYSTFDAVIMRISSAEESLTIMSFCSVRAEQMGEIASAIEISNQMVRQAPENVYCWSRGCFLRYRYQSKAQQRKFQKKIPNSLLQYYSSESAAILYFLAQAGNFKRAEAHWVAWFIADPRECAVELVNFHLGLIFSNEQKVELEASARLEQCLAALQYEQDGSTMIRLIVDEHLDSSEYTLKASSQLAKLLQSLFVGESRSLGMVSYKLMEFLPPYVACLRIALELRHKHNDGSDCFAMLSIPTDTDQLVPFLEEKLVQDTDSGKQLSKVNDIPLYMRGHALSPDNAFKGALNCWTDTTIPKPLLFAQGNASPNSVVLDAYGIGYLAVTDLVKCLLDLGISLVLPIATKEFLKRWVEEMSSESFMQLGVSEDGKLYRTTATEIKAHYGHILQALRLLLESASVMHPVSHDIALEVYSIKSGIDVTVYDAMQLSLANKIPWFCMDETFASLHHSNQHATVNVQAILARAMTSSPFDLEQKRHGFLLYALDAIPLPFTLLEVYRLAAHPNALAGFILLKIIQNHGHQVFSGSDRTFLLLDMILAHLHSRFFSGRSHDAVRPSYTLSTDYTAHIFNHGIKLFIGANQEGTAESRLAEAIKYMVSEHTHPQRFIDYIFGRFISFAKGHFMDIGAVEAHLQSLAYQARS